MGSDILKNIYLDYSATTMPEKEVLEVYNEIALDNYYNANSIYEASRLSKEKIDKAKV